MQISKYLCIMIIGAIVIAISASPLQKRSSSIFNSQSQSTYNTNQCSTGNQYCCNNAQNSNNAQLQNGNNAGSIFYHKQSNKQLACSNYNNNSSMGTQTTGCQQNMYCCQNMQCTFSLIVIQCSPITITSG
ncbi:unnamed protein product [Adineta steineri]|uniref:Uncharacterized protein n=1 Tax=Adineta steineri TaxID=433720 RepID=A0A818QDN8_9BILA|nr:unnamed protein product [Adineta steineri]